MKKQEVEEEDGGERKENDASDQAGTEQGDGATDAHTETKSRRKRVVLSERPFIEERIPKAGETGAELKSCLKGAVGKKSYAGNQRVTRDIRGRITHGPGKNVLTEEDCKVQ